MRVILLLLKNRKPRKNKSILFLFFLSVAVQFGCGNASHEPDVKDIKIDLQTRRLDNDLAYLDTNYVGQGLQQLKEVYPDFLDFYLDTLMGFGVNGKYADSVAAVKSNLRPFLTHKDIRGLFDTVSKHYPGTKSIDENLKKGFQYMKYYYPGFHAPKIIYFISGLNQWSVITVDTSIVGIGLDMYLGSQYPFYNAVQIPEYVIRKCKEEYIVPNVFQAIYRNKHPFIMEEKTLLDMMIQRGKEQYFLSKIIPFTDDTLRLGFTKAQLEWCESSEAQVYNFFVRDNLLYETNMQKVVRYVNDGPNAAGMPAESPGNIGSWLGWQIIKSYIKQHPETTINELLQKNDAQQILQESKYKPH